SQYSFVKELLYNARKMITTQSPGSGMTRLSPPLQGKAGRGWGCRGRACPCPWRSTINPRRATARVAPTVCI
ncbi:MAG: hypothetical protein JW902_13945, partial [Syntrophaceae bacterium]|nr:hypothetical protein [Syntrophaceae bacterium]